MLQQKLNSWQRLRFQNKYKLTICSNIYSDYASLRDHFRNKHFLCQEGACSGQEIRLTHAFRSRIDLQAHTTSEHGNNLTKAQAKQMRTIDIDYQFAPRERRRDRGTVNFDMKLSGSHFLQVRST